MNFKNTSILLTCSIVALFAITPAFAESYTSILTLDPISSKIKTGDIVIFSGQLTTTSGYIIPNVTIYIKDDVYFGRDKIIKTLQTDSNGEFYGTWTAKSRSSGAWDFYAVYDGTSNVSESRSYTQNVKVLSNYSSNSGSNSGNSPSYDSSYPTLIKFDKIPSSIYAGEYITFTGKVTTNGKPLNNAYVKILEDDPFISDQELGAGYTDSDGRFSVDWYVGAGLVETDFDIYAVFDGNSNYDRTRSYNQEMSILKYGGHITLDSFPSRVKIGDVVTFSGTLSLDGFSPEGAIVYIKDEDALNPDDLLVTGYVDRYGKFSANWFASNVDEDSVADIYAVFEGNDALYRLTTCDKGYTKSFGASCSYTKPLSISGYAPITPPSNNIPSGEEYMELDYSLNFPNKPHVAIVPSPDSYNDVKKHIIPVKNGIRMLELSLEEKYGGVWDVTFEVVEPGSAYFTSKPDIVVNLVTHDEDEGCTNEYYGWASLEGKKPIQTTVCSTSSGQSRSNVDVSATTVHEFIHAVGLGHTFNKDGDLMCSAEYGIPTCNNLYSKSKIPSALNLQAIVEVYGKDGYTNPNNNVISGSKFSLNNYNSYDDDFNNNDYTYTPPVTTSTKCERTDYKYDSEIDNEKLNSGWYVSWTLCTDEQINYYFTTNDKYNGFMIFLLPPETDVSSFIDYRDGDYYTCEEYEETWLSKGGSCNVAPGSSIVIYNHEDNSIWIDGYIKN